MGKKTRVRRKSTDDVPPKEPTPKELAEKSRRDQTERMTQLMALRKQITDRIGNIFHEIPEFVMDAAAWVRDGKLRNGYKMLTIVSKMFEWRFYDNIRKYPEVFLRASGPSPG